MSKEETIILITERIKSEHRKHKEIEWERIAAYKIYASLNKLYNLHGVIKAERAVCDHKEYRWMQENGEEFDECVNCGHRKQTDI